MTIKWIISPITDTFYIKQLGKRKTYIVFVEILIGATLILTSFWVDYWVENINLNPLILNTFIIEFFS